MTDYVRVATLDQVPPGRGRPVFVAGRTVALFNVDGEIYALDDACPHQGSSLGMGKLDGAIVTCRAHGLRFDVRTGCMRGVDGLRATTCMVRVTGDDIAIAVDSLKPQPVTTTSNNDERPQGRGDSKCTAI